MQGPVLVTGATGFVGRRLIDELGRLAIPAIAVGGMTDDPVSCDLRDPAAVDDLIGRYQPATIVHLAAISSVGQAGEHVPLTWDLNFGGTCNLARACSALQHSVRFVFASSAEVYGASFLDGPCDERAPLQPLSTYARSKAAAEWLLRDMASPTFQVLVARPFNHIGPGQDVRFVVPSFAAQIAAAGTAGVVKVGNLEAARDFSDVDDLVDALATLALAPYEPDYGAFNIGSGKTRTIRSLLDELIEISGTSVRVEVDPQRVRPVEVPVAGGSRDAFSQAFGPRTHRPLERTLRAVLAAACAASAEQ